MNPIIDAEQTSPRKSPQMKMIFHFARILDSDIPVEGATEGECLDKALAEWMKQCKPVAVKGEVIE